MSDRILRITTPPMRGDDIASIQTKLSNLGYSVGKVDGVYGSLTESAIKRFQTDAKIKVDGIAGSQTKGVLDSPKLTRLLSVQKPLIRGLDIRFLQSALVKAGQKLSVDGIFGSQTALKVRAYQKSKSLKVDGIVGQQTWNALFNGVAPPKPVEQNDTDDDVKRLQQLLNKFGFNCGAEDGYYGGKTKVAVTNFQKKMGLRADGVVSKATWGALEAPSLERFRLWGFIVLLHERNYKFMVQQFQSAMSLKPDGIVGANTLNALAKSVIKPRFTETDMKCQCNKYCSGYPSGKISLAPRVIAERGIRETLKKYPNAKFYITNRNTPAPNGAIAGGYRCTQWNKVRGGASGSQHRVGLAVDIGCNDSKARAELEKNIMAINTYGGVGYGARYIVHIDTRGRRSRWKY